MARFKAGAGSFTEVEDVPGGLGPVFTEKSCVVCHGAGGTGGAGLRTVTRIGRLLNGQYDNMVAFGGPQLDQLYVTSSSQLLAPEERGAWPLAGALFRITGIGVRGLPEPEFAMAGGESLVQLRARLERCLEEIAAQGHAKVILVTHGGALDALYRIATGTPYSTVRGWELANASINDIVIEKCAWRVVGWGDIAHLNVTSDDFA